MPPTDEEILDAALRVFEDAGFRGATTKRIADEAGVNEVTLFRKFGTKDRLLLEALRHGGHASAPATLPEEPVDARAELTTWASHHLGRMMQARVMMRSSMCEVEAHPGICASASDGPMRIHRELTDYLEHLRTAGLARGDWEAPIAASLLMGALFAEAIGHDVMPDRHGYDVDGIAERFVSLFLVAVGVVPKRAP